MTSFHSRRDAKCRLPSRARFPSSFTGVRVWVVFGWMLSQSLAAVAWSDSVTGYRPDYQRVSGESIAQDKNFYLLTLLQASPKVREELEADPTLTAIQKRMITPQTGVATDVADPKAAAPLSANSMTFSAESIGVARAVLMRRLQSSPALQALVKNHLRPSGTYQRQSERSDAEMLGEAWTEAARGINHIIGQFALGIEIPYPKIDSPSYSLDAPGYQRMILEARNAAASSARPNTLFFEPSLDFALRLMAINRRDEAARHEPLASGENRVAMKAMRNMDWAAYPYASVLVYGDGPNDAGVAISEEGRARCASAAELYKAKKAPFIIVSGGYVHPKQTIFSEAIEMKRELMLVHGIPEFAILVDPHARHTTTNLRNGARILFAGGVPADKPSLSVSSREHIDSIVSADFVQRCESELGYMPARLGRRISDVAAEFTALLDSLQIDPSDPLDP